MTVDLATRLAAAKLRADGRMYLPAADYVLSAALVCDHAGLHIYGDGMGKTRLICDGLAISGVVELLALSADRITMRDLTIIITNTTGSGSLVAIAAGAGATATQITRVEVVGGYGTTTAGGAGFTFYQPPSISNGRQFATVEDCIARDAGPACGFVINSSGNTFTRCQASRVGQTVTQHGYYEQGGDNHFVECRADSVFGYSFHGHKQTGQDDMGSTWRGCVSVDPGTQHMIVDGLNDAGGHPLTRAVLVDGCTFKRSAGGPHCSGVGISVPGVVTNCIFEDTAGAASFWLSMPNGGVAAQNIFRWLNGGAGIGVRSNGVISGNTFVNWSAGQAIVADAGGRVLGNTLELNATGGGITPAGNDVEIGSNCITGTTNGAGVNNYISAYTGFMMHHNIMRLPNGKAAWISIPPSGALTDNQLSSLVVVGSNPDLRIADNIIGV